MLNILFGYICLVSRKSIRIVVDFLEEFPLRGKELNALWGSSEMYFHITLVGKNEHLRALWSLSDRNWTQPSLINRSSCKLRWSGASGLKQCLRVPVSSIGSFIRWTSWLAHSLRLMSQHSNPHRCERIPSVSLAKTCLERLWWAWLGYLLLPEAVALGCLIGYSGQAQIRMGIRGKGWVSL